ncbi:hypothetical protein, partial [Aeromonas caviae]|uniref:hypothetical protein n=1 Tax=Aeromonas caviae TaxID=648 RepID=UPI001F48E32F
MDADHGFPSRVKSDRLGMLLSDRHGCYYVIGMNVIERSPCVGICNSETRIEQLDHIFNLIGINQPDMED